MLAQLPPVTAPNSGIPVMDAFYLMFPALSSLLRWGSLFPAQSILGAVPDTLTPAASKVVLVLADDANAHKSRVTRQNAPDPPAAAAPPAAPGLLGQIQALGQGLGQNLGQGLGQNLGQGLGQDLGQNLAQGLGQTLSQGLGQNLAQGLGQNLAQGLGQNLGQGLGQNLGQDLGQGLGQNLGQGLGQNLGQGLGQNLGQSIGQSLGQIVSQLPPPLGQGPLFPPIPGLLGQAAPPTPAPTTPAPPADDPPTDAQAAPPAAAAPPPSVGAPNPFAANPFAANPFAANPFMDTNLLGQALPPMPPMPAMPPVGQLPQPHELMAGLTQFWQGGQVAQASDISEVRVKPETITYRHPQPHPHPHGHHHAHEQHMEAKRAQLKIKSALQMQQEQQREQQQCETKDKMPLLWFRTPATDAQQEQTEQQGIHSKLLAFERQVISELKMLQQIESMARELRATAHGEAAPATYRLRYPLSRTPVHKITREDIERALRDDFVRRLLYKEAQRKAQQPDEHVANIKRQTQQPLSTEDMAKVMAYAYRMAQDAQNQEKEKQKIYAAYRAGSEQGTVAQVGVMGDEAKTRPPPSIVAPQQDAMTRFRAEAPGTLPTDPMTFQTPSMFMQPLQPRQMNPVGFQSDMFMQQPGQPAMMMQQPVQMSRGWAEANAMQAFQQQNPALQQQHRMDDLTRWQTEKMRAMQMQQHAERAHQQAQAELRRGKEIQQQAELADRKAQEEKVNAMQQAEQAERQIKENERDITDTADDLADPTVGEATPQIPPTAGQERHKGNLYGVFRNKETNLSPDVADPLGLGGHHKKHKSKSATPTIINYYSTPQVAPVAPAYAPQPVAPSSYGTSYGGGGYGSNAYAGVAYRAAIGNDEIDNMLREHRTLAVS